MCLLRAPALIDNGLEAIPHWLPGKDALYVKLLRGEPLPDQLALADFDDDVQPAVGPLALVDRARSYCDPLPVADAFPSPPDGSDDGDSNHDSYFGEHFGQDVLAAEFSEEHRDGQGGEGGLLFHRTPKFQWGSFKFNVKPPGPTRPHGVWQVQCPFRKLRDTSY